MRGFQDLVLALTSHEPSAILIPDEEIRRRMIQSYSARLPHEENSFSTVKNSADPSKHSKWLANQEKKIEEMKRAVAELQAGRPLAEVHDPDALSETRSVYRVYQEDELQESEARSFLGDKVEPLLSLANECERSSQPESLVKGTMFPDVVAKKDGRYLLIEIKTNDAELSRLQRYVLKIAPKYGFEIKVLRVSLHPSISEDQPKLE